MKNKFNRIIAGLMATASLATGIIGMGASAADVTTPAEPEITERYAGPTGYISFGNGATAGIYRDENLIFLSTEGRYSNSIVSVKLTSASYRTINEGTGTTYEESDGYVSHSYSGTGITHAEGSHIADGSEPQASYR